MFNNPTIFEIAGIALAVISLALFIFLWRKQNKLDRFKKEFLRGRSGRDLEEVIIDTQRDLKKTLSDIKKLSQANKILAELHQLSIQRVGMVRFNSFAGEGGNQSFAIALLDARGDGVVISSIYGRDTQRVFAKHVKNGESKSPLTEEEKQAILESRDVEAYDREIAESGGLKISKIQEPPIKGTKRNIKKKK